MAVEIITSFRNIKLGKAVNVYGTFDEPLFLAKEIGELLGFTNIRVTLSRMSSKFRVTDCYTKFGARQVTFLKEPGLYALIMRSNKPEAVAFQEWICEEVLPSIRKTGKFEQIHRPVVHQLAFHIQTEFDLHAKLINFINHAYPEALITPSLGEFQTTGAARIKARRMGYQAGTSDIIINNLHKQYRGFAIELKTPKGTGTISAAQTKMLGKYKQNGFKTLVTNDYDTCLLEIAEYFKGVRVGCEHCARMFKTTTSLQKHRTGFHRILVA